MKRNLLIAFCLFFCAAMNAQTSIPNMGLEDWTASARYDQPAGGVWATPNASLDALPAIGLPEAPVKKESGAGNVHGGAYSAKLKTVTIFGSKASGTIYTGKFAFNLANPTSSAKLGTPFTARPDRFKGWLKYTPANGDSCLVYARFTRKNPTTNQREQVGIARKVYTSAVANYTQFDLPVVYSSTASPDTMIIVCTSSAAADNLAAPQAGSTMYIDDLELTMPVGTTLDAFAMTTVQAFPNPTSERLTITTGIALYNASIAFYAPDGKLVATKPLENGSTTTNLSVGDLPTNTYIYNVMQNGINIGVGKVSIER